MTGLLYSLDLPVRWSFLVFVFLLYPQTSAEQRKSSPRQCLCNFPEDGRFPFDSASPQGLFLILSQEVFLAALASSLLITHLNEGVLHVYCLYVHDFPSVCPDTECWKQMCMLCSFLSKEYNLRLQVTLVQDWHSVAVNNATLSHPGKRISELIRFPQLVLLMELFWTKHFDTL